MDINKTIQLIDIFDNINITVEDVTSSEEKENHQKSVIVTYQYKGKQFKTKKLFYKNAKYAEHVIDPNLLENFFGNDVYWLDINVHDWPKPSGESDLDNIVIKDMFEGENPEFEKFLKMLANNDKTGIIQLITQEGRPAQYHHNLENNNHWHDLIILIKEFIKNKGNDIDKKYFNHLIFNWNQKEERKSLHPYFGNRKIISDLQKNLRIAFKKIDYMEKLYKQIQLLNNQKNLIFTGAPGTGKTYLAKQIAAYMVSGKNDGSKLSDEEKKQIGFVQFHPSYDYTDFVEGLRPVMKENGDLGFELKNGTFKEFCKKSLENFHDEQKAEKEFNEVWKKLLKIVQENEEKGQKTKIGTQKYFLSNANSLKFKAENAPSQYQHTITKQNLFDIYRNKPARPSRGDENYMKQILSFMKENLGLKDFNTFIKPYIFIIDEINRAEISKVFGELFFAIDPGYRGEKGKVKTQYANMQTNETAFINKDDDYFYVPENVFIIGTMNDIDRSVDTFDFAMRRRFAWKEILAEDRMEMWDGLIDTYKDEAETRLKKINDAIESEKIGLNRSYHIGPAYFLKLNNYDENPFEELWNNHLEVLLREYLRGMPDVENKMKYLKDAYDLKNQQYEQDNNSEG